MSSYVALLRGINVGGNNIIKMTDLQAYFLSLGFARVRTYIQSGNVIFDTQKTSPTHLAQKLRQHLNKNSDNPLWL